MISRPAIDGELGPAVQKQACFICYSELVALGLSGAFIATATAASLWAGIEAVLPQMNLAAFGERERAELLLRGAVRHVLLRDAVLLN